MLRDRSPLATLLPLLLCAGVVLVAVGCPAGDPPAGARPAAPVQEAPPARAQDEGGDAAHRFDPDRLAVGQRFLGLEVTERNLARAEAMGEGVYVGTVGFSGEITVTGTYGPHPDHPEVRALCFEVDEASAPRVPRMQGDERRLWFCFTNQEEAVRRLGPPEAGGHATIVIDDYRIVRFFTDVFNTAALVRVLD